MQQTLQQEIKKRRIWRFTKRFLEFILFLIVVFIIIFIFLNAPALIHKIEQRINQEKIKADFEERVSKNDLVNNSLIIPRAGIYVPIIFPESSEREVIKEGLKEGAVHIPETPIFSKEGTAAILGHYSNYFWRGGKYNFIFSTLRTLRENDEIYIRYNNETIKYLVTGKETLSAKKFDIASDIKDVDLKLTTYWPIGTEFWRLVVYAVKQ